MAKLTNEELIEAFKELTIIELSEFVKLFEETFEVTAAAVAVAGPAAGAAVPISYEEVAEKRRAKCRTPFKAQRRDTGWSLTKLSTSAERLINWPIVSWLRSPQPSTCASLD